MNRLDESPVVSQSKLLSPRRKTTEATSVAELAAEQLAHFHVPTDTPMGRRLLSIAERLYETESDMQELWTESVRALASMDRADRIAAFNAKKFLCFQLAKIADTLNNPFRRSYQSLGYSRATSLAKGPFPIFDNLTAIFSATPVITRTATYIFACSEWVDDAFNGRELMLEIYSRLLNPTSICLANHIVDIECGHLAQEYFAWNFNSGMAAIDSALSNLVGHQDVILASRNIYGGAYQLLHDWFAKPSNLDIAVEHFDGTGAAEFEKALEAVKLKYADRLARGRHVFVYLESPCNPHGYLLDVPAICARAHAEGLVVLLDATVATPFLSRPLMRENPAERPDFLIHSYTKDLSAGASTTAGVVIGRNEDMFIPKGESLGEKHWHETMFWNVFYVKGAFLDADKAFEVLAGMRTLEMRMLQKCITTRIFAEWLASHPKVRVNCNALASDSNNALLRSQHFLGLPAPLFTIDMEMAGFDRPTYERFFDSLSPMFGHMVSLGMCNTVALCPALTTHSELSREALRAAGIYPTTIRLSIGDEPAREIIGGFLSSAQLALDPECPGFTDGFMKADEVDALADRLYVEIHAAYAKSQARLAECLK